MKNPLWTQALKSCADPHRARHYWNLLAATTATPALENLSADQARVLASLFSGSAALVNLLVANPEWFSALKPELLKHPRREQGLRQETESWLKPMLAAGKYEAGFDGLRQFKQREMLRIAARDLARLGKTPEIIREISDVADVCLGGVLRLCLRQFTARYGQPYHQDADGQWQPTAFCVLGLGKLGGQELNYSSDVDVIFVYGGEGQVFKEPPAKAKAARPVMPSHQFFNRLAEAFIAEVARLTPGGTLFRIDLRLRPEGDTGPLCRSLDSYENYYAQWGQTWERMMLMKARCVAGDQQIAAEFLETINPFRYPRSINEGVLREVAAMKDRIEKEVVKAGEVERNVKLGRGGIREIEFTVQSLQLLHAGRMPFLQNAQTLPCLEKLAQYKLLSLEEAQALATAYCFLRDVEHRLQMEDNRQTHTIPTDRQAQERLARLMDFPTLKDFEPARQTHCQNVRRVYDRLLKTETSESKSEFPREFAGAEAQWQELLARHSFREPDKAFRMLKEFAEGPGYVHVSPRTIELARQLIPPLLARCQTASPTSQISNLKSHILSDPDRVLTRLDSFISAYGARAALFETWTSNPSLFELLVQLFDRSEFLAEMAIRTPDLVDELVVSGRLRQRKTAGETLADLRHGLADEDQRLWLRRYHQAEFMRIGLRDILGLADFEQHLVELSALADACLQYALEVMMRKNRIKAAPFVIIGLGKLGGAEIDYGSDLDILFVADPKVKDLPKRQRLAVEVMDLLSGRTELGVAFHTDARLRPDGEKGLLVNTLDAYEEYYRHRAQLWEIQSLTRTRSVAGDMALGQRFQELVSALSDFRPENVAAGFSLRAGARADNRKLKLAAANHKDGLAAYTPDWKQMIHQMRLRIEKDRTPTGKDDLAIKTGTGGLMDVEFIAQALCLEHGWQEANTLRALERAREDKALPDADKLIENYRQLRRVEGILRRWSYEGETVLPDDPAPYYRVSVRCGFSTPESFREALAKWRHAIREVYLKVFAT